MAETDVANSSGMVSKSLAARLLGVIVSPRATYADVAARPRALGAILVILLLAGASTFAFLSTEIGQNAMLDQIGRAHV